MQIRTRILVGAAVLFCAVSTTHATDQGSHSDAAIGRGADDLSLWKIQQDLAAKRYVDLTHEFGPGIPHWPGFPGETRKTIYWYEKRPDTMGAGFFSELFTHVGQWGTHVDPPAHFY